MIYHKIQILCDFCSRSINIDLKYSNDFKLTAKENGWFIAYKENRESGGDMYPVCWEQYKKDKKHA